MFFRLFGKAMVYNSNDAQGQTLPVTLGFPVINSLKMGCLWGAPDPCLIAINCAPAVRQSLWATGKRYCYSKTPTIHYLNNRK